jgi:hypothetical protein
LYDKYLVPYCRGGGGVGFGAGGRAGWGFAGGFGFGSDGSFGCGFAGGAGSGSLGTSGWGFAGGFGFGSDGPFGWGFAGGFGAGVGSGSSGTSGRGRGGVGALGTGGKSVGGIVGGPGGGFCGRFVWRKLDNAIEDEVMTISNIRRIGFIRITPSLFASFPWCNRRDGPSHERLPALWRLGFRTSSRHSASGCGHVLKRTEAS